MNIAIHRRRPPRGVSFGRGALVGGHGGRNVVMLGTLVACAVLASPLAGAERVVTLPDVSLAALAIDRSGDTILMWSRSDDLAGLWFVRGRKPGGWTAPEPLFLSGSAERMCTSVRLTPTVDGMIMVGWQVVDISGPQRHEVWAARVGRWARDTVPPQLLGEAGFAKLDSEVAADVDGHGVAIWASWESLDGPVVSRRYDPEYGWGPLDVLSRDGGGQEIALAIDGAGRAVATWTNGGRQSAHVASWDRKNGWTVSRAGVGLRNPALAVDDAGRGLAMWRGVTEIAEAAYDPASGWCCGRIVFDELTYVGPPAVGMSDDASALAAWTTRDGVRWSRRAALGPWSAAQDLARGRTLAAQEVHLAVDRRGRAIAAWREGSPQLAAAWSAVYVPDHGWSHPRRVGPAEPIVNGLDVAIGPDGTAFVAGLAREAGGAFTVWIDSLRLSEH